MKSAIIGLPGAGRQSVFEALTGVPAAQSTKAEDRIAAINVPDERIDALSRMYRPRKTIYAQVEFLLPDRGTYGGQPQREQALWSKVRDADALIHVVRNFTDAGGAPPRPQKDYLALSQEMILADLIVAEKRIERLALDAKRGKKPNPEELSLLETCRLRLEDEQPLRRFPELCGAKLLRGYAFLSAKPVMILSNNPDDDDSLPDMASRNAGEKCLVIRGRLELELAQMNAADAAEFLTEFGIRTSARNRVIRQAYDLLGLVSFFTVGDDEVRAWTVRQDTAAVDAAEVIHSDIKKGFIRAEVVSYNDLMAAGSTAEARKRGTLRLEGKTYCVQDGDIINFRFNV